MFGAIARKIFGTTNDRLIKANRKVVEAINALEPELRGSGRRGGARTDGCFPEPAGRGREPG